MFYLKKPVHVGQNTNTTTTQNHLSLAHMNKDTLRACVSRLLPRQALAVTFLSGTCGVAGLRKMLTLKDNGRQIDFEHVEMKHLRHVEKSNTWGNVSTTLHIQQVKLLGDQGLDSIASAIQSVSCGEHFAIGIFSADPARQLAAVHSIAAKVLDFGLTKEIKSWDLTEGHELVWTDGLPALQISLYHGPRPIFQISLDGWSGRLMTNQDPWSNERCTDIDQIQGLIREGMEAYIAAPSVATVPAFA